MTLTDELKAAGITVDGQFRPGDLGSLIHVHGVQNSSDYGFNEIHEAYCARIAADFILKREPRRQRVWLARKAGVIIGSVFICEPEPSVAQLRLLFVDASARGLGLGRWLVEEAVGYCREAGFDRIFLWTVEGLDRAKNVYTSLGFVVTETKGNTDWRDDAVEVRYDLVVKAR
ncbi:MAG: GNAT family N-acetyltransferase [Myxococcales bacterium]|nr:GNAT family N-acetyltransferase [Myxococcales bacterium]